MIFLREDILFKVATIESTFTFAKYFFRKGFWAQWTMDKQQTQKTYLQRNPKKWRHKTTTQDLEKKQETPKTQIQDSKKQQTPNIKVELILD